MCSYSSSNVVTPALQYKEQEQAGPIKHDKHGIITFYHFNSNNLFEINR